MEKQQVTDLDSSTVLTLETHEEAECSECQVPTPISKMFSVWNYQTQDYELVCEVCRGLSTEEHEEIFAY